METNGIPERFARTMIEMHGDAGQAWLDELPARIEEYERGWAIQVAPAFRQPVVQLRRSCCAR